MALTVGIRNGTDKGFTKEELDITNSFGMGILSMVTGVSDFGRRLSWRTDEVMTVDKAHARFCMACHVNDTWDELKPYVTDIEFVQRMADADWSTNCGNRTDQEFLEVMADDMIENAMRAVGDERSHLGWKLRRNFQGTSESMIVKDRIQLGTLQQIHTARDYLASEEYKSADSELLELSHALVDRFNLYGQVIAWDEHDNELCYEVSEDGYGIVLTTKLEQEE